MSIEANYHEKFPIAYWDWQAWLKDEGVRSTSLGARGLWFELLGCMRKWRNYGVLCTRAGFPMKLGEIAELVNAPIHQIKPLLDELEKAGVFSRSKKGAIYCRRMKREAPVLATIGQLTNQKGIVLDPPPPLPPIPPLSPSPQNIYKYNKEASAKPTLQQVIDFGQRINANEKLCRKFYSYYNTSNWCNKYGKEVEWRQSLKNWASTANSEPVVRSSCESRPVRFEDSVDHARLVLESARMASDSVLTLALVTYSKSVVHDTLAVIGDTTLIYRVNKLYESIKDGQK